MVEALAYRREERVGVWVWTWVVFGWVVLEFAGMVGLMVPAIFGWRVGWVWERAFWGVCFVMPVGFVMAVCDLGCELTARGVRGGWRRWPWVSVMGVVLSVASPGVIWGVVWWVRMR
ncbi:MAG TPA: hypothetical protein VH253_19280 [Phycisphaerae bacterium]|nr:hypothetical protein [Phycisphaerae bacterium]